MDRKLETWVAAENLIAKHGETAAAQAARRARQLAVEGKNDEAAIWAMVHRAIEDIQSGQPGPSGASGGQPPLSQGRRRDTTANCL